MLNSLKELNIFWPLTLVLKHHGGQLLPVAFIDKNLDFVQAFAETLMEHLSIWSYWKEDRTLATITKTEKTKQWHYRNETTAKLCKIERRHTFCSQETSCGIRHWFLFTLWRTWRLRSYEDNQERCCPKHHRKNGAKLDGIHFMYFVVWFTSVEVSSLQSQCSS